MSRIVIITGFIGIAGLILGLNLNQNQPNFAPPSQNQDSKGDKRELQVLIDSNQILTSRIDILETQHKKTLESVQTLTSELSALKLLFNNKNDGDIKDSIASFTQNDSITTANNDASQPTNPRVNEPNSQGKQALVAMGIDEVVTARIQERQEKVEMDRLYLRNTAIREGWFGTEKYFEKTRDLDSNTNVYREELGDENYDQYLFSTGQNNRISISSVISSSPAENAGLLSGDIVASYDNERIFSWSDLTHATTTGEIGETVSIVVQRDSDELELFVPRGPLGIRLENLKLDPDN